MVGVDSKGLNLISVNRSEQNAADSLMALEWILSDYVAIVGEGLRIRALPARFLSLPGQPISEFIRPFCKWV